MGSKAQEPRPIMAHPPPGARSDEPHAAQRLQVRGCVGLALAQQRRELFDAQVSLEQEVERPEALRIRKARRHAGELSISGGTATASEALG